MSNGNAITYALSGRLGNQLQLFACARTLSLRYDWRFIYRPIIHADKFNFSNIFSQSLQDKSDLFLVDRVLALHYKVKPQASRRHQLMQTLVQPFRHVIYLDDSSWDMTNGMMGESAPLYQQMRDTLFVLRFNGIFRNVGEYRNQLLKEILPSSVTLANGVIEKYDVGIHLRQGDRQADVEYGLPMSYYFNAVRKAMNILASPIRLHLFTDGDPASLALQLRENVDVDVVIHHADVVEDILSLARYPTLILSMSWFSYWAAYFSNNSLVFVPRDFQYYSHWRSVAF